MTIQEFRRPSWADGHPSPEDITVLHSGVSPDSTLAICIDGEDMMFTLNRHALFKLMSECAKALKEMEPLG